MSASSKEETIEQVRQMTLEDLWMIQREVVDIRENLSWATVKEARDMLRYLEKGIYTKINRIDTKLR